VSDPIVTVEEISPIKKKLSFNIPWEKVKSELDLTYKKIGNSAKIKGFRPGKIPRAILEKYYRDQSEEETEVGIINQYYWDALIKEGIKAVNIPQIEHKGIEIGKDYAFSVIVEVEPDIEPKNYMGLEIISDEVKISDEDVSQRLEEIRQTFATLEEIVEDRGAEKGDFLVIDFNGNIEGKLTRELTGIDQIVEIGAGRLNLPLEDKLIGMRKGDEKTFELEMPADHPIQVVRGKRVNINVKIKGIRAMKLPPLDEEFIKNFDKFDSLEHLKEEIRKQLLEEKSMASEANMISQLEQKLLDNNQFEVPETLINRQSELLMSNGQRKMRERGISQEQINDFLNKYSKEYRDEAAKTIKLMLLTKKIAEKECINVDDHEIDQRIEELANRSRQEYEVVRKYFENNGMIEDIRIDLLSKKTYDYLLKHAKVVSTNTKGME
jgi:trigger factor